MRTYISAVPDHCVYAVVSKRYSLHAKIKNKGYHEQERQYLFPSLYGSKSVTRNTMGQYKTFDRQLRRGKYAPSF